MSESTKEIHVLDHIDQVIVLNNGTRLIARVVTSTFSNEAGEDVHDMEVLYIPYMLYYRDGNLMMSPWIRETSDVLIQVPSAEILTMVTPEVEIGSCYINQLREFLKPVSGDLDEGVATEEDVIH